MEDLTTVVSEFAVSIDTVWILIAAVLVMFMQAWFRPGRSRIHQNQKHR